MVPTPAKLEPTLGFDFAEGPMCKAPVELAACNAETEKYPFYHDPDQNSCLVRWQVDAGCLTGGNRFGTASECSKRCIKSTASAASAGEGRGEALHYVVQNTGCAAD
ncbi:hypothetical protein V5799_019954 [Amblyomma americanum]|uniref:BPTI/Kunitz inhibitor domain-containing protein n=1 Tax=Amblyomma americanum TaxID=6943 RepID=A0AAQ4EVT4_AMBAM